MDLSTYKNGTCDFREQIKINERRTRYVIFLFVLIYIAVGFLADIALLKSKYAYLPPADCFYLLITLKQIPILTIGMGIVASVSVWITFLMYDKIMLMGTEYHEITPETAQSVTEKQLYNVVEEMTVAAGMRFIPKVYIIEANYMNAFASGYSEQSAMVAITRGLMEKLDRSELQAVMAHELSHIRHFDIKLTLMVAVLSNILLIVLDLLFYSTLYDSDNKRKNDNGWVMVIILLRYTLPIITVALSLFLSRTREFMADAGAVELMRDNQPLARALIKIHEDHETHLTEYEQAYGQTPHEQIRQSSYLFDPSEVDPVKSLHNVFSTHPTLEERLAALGIKT